MATLRCRRCGEQKPLPYAKVAWVDTEGTEERYHWCRDCLELHAADLIGMLPPDPEGPEDAPKPLPF